MLSLGWKQYDDHSREQAAIVAAASEWAMNDKRNGEINATLQAIRDSAYSKKKFFPVPANRELSRLADITQLSSSLPQRSAFRRAILNYVCSVDSLGIRLAWYNQTSFSKETYPTQVEEFFRANPYGDYLKCHALAGETLRENYPELFAQVDRLRQDQIDISNAERRGGMDAGNLAQWASVIAAFVAAAYARKAANAARRTSEQALLHQTLVNVLSEYRAAEMLVAIESLWDFKDEHPNDLGAAYETRRKEDKEMLQSVPLRDRMESLRTTIHYRRRLVSQFYGLLAGLYKEGVIPKKTLYTHWTAGDLRIIPQVLIPIEKALGMALGRSPSGMSPSLQRMQDLYDDSPKDTTSSPD